MDQFYLSYEGFKIKMGCIALKSKIQHFDNNAESLPPRSIEQMNKIQKKRKSVRKISGFVETESDFWGTVPFYVLKNRIRLLAYEVKDPAQILEIYESILEIFSFFLEGSTDYKCKFGVTDKKFFWIAGYEQGIKVIRSVGLKVENKNLELMEGVRKNHLKKKMQETKFVFSSLFDNSLNSQTI